MSQNLNPKPHRVEVSRNTLNNVINQPKQEKAMDYSKALELIKEGEKLQREGWNGKNMFIFHVPGSIFEVNRPPLLGIFPEGKIICYLDHTDMVTADGSVVPWLCSQDDAYADDWQVVDVVHDAEQEEA